MSCDSNNQSSDRTTNSNLTPFSYEELREINIQISSAWFKPPKSTQLTLMEVHPWRLHAYWNITDADMTAAREKLSDDTNNPTLVLRFIDLATQRNQHVHDHRFDIEVHGLTNSWYVDLWQDSRHYLAQLGLRNTDGELIILTNSNEVTLPRATPSNELDFKQREVLTPLPSDFNITKAESNKQEYLLKNLFPECAPQKSDTSFEEPESPALNHAADKLIDRPIPFKHELEILDYTHPVRSPVLTENSEFPSVKKSELAPYSMLANKEKFRMLSEIEIELPALAKETISVSDIPLSPKPLVLFNDNLEQDHKILSGATVPKTTNKSVSLNPPEDLLHQDFSETLTNANTNASEFPISFADTSVNKTDYAPFERQDNIINTGHTGDTHGIFSEESNHELFTDTARPSPRSVIALEEVLSNSFFSYRGNESSVKVSAELHLQGKLESDSVLSFLGEPVQTDKQGNFSVNVKLNSSPALSTLLYTQGKWNKGHH